MFSILGGTCQHPQTLVLRLTPFSLKSHCSGGCRVVLGHTVSFTLKLTGFGVFLSSSWPEEKVGRLGLGSCLPSLICLPAPRVQPLGSPYACLAMGSGRRTEPTPALAEHTAGVDLGRPLRWLWETKGLLEERHCHWTLKAQQSPCLCGRQWSAGTAPRHPQTNDPILVPGTPRSP